MSTQQQIDDPGQWRVGDMFEGEFDGHPFSGPIWALGMDLYVGGLVVRHGAQWVPSDKTGHITRTVEPIPEPTEPWALVRFADGTVMTRMRYSVRPWTGDGRSGWPWEDVTAAHGAPVAVSLPRWSDEADGLRARVEKLAEVTESEAEEYDRQGRRDAGAASRITAIRLRDLLAEGGEA